MTKNKKESIKNIVDSAVEQDQEFKPSLHAIHDVVPMPYSECGYSDGPNGKSRKISNANVKSTKKTKKQNKEQTL